MNLQNVFVKANPQLSKGLTEGMTLRIPKTNSDKSNWVSEQSIEKAVKKVNSTKSEQKIHIVKEDETGTTFKICVQLNFELERMILGMGECITILGPRRLKQRIYKSLKEAVGNYSKDENIL